MFKFVFKKKYMYVAIWLSLAAFTLISNLLTHEQEKKKDVRNLKLSKEDFLRNNNIVCMIITSDKTLQSRAIAVWKSWAKYCNITFFGCNCKKKNITYTEFLTRTKNVVHSSELPILYLNIEEVYMKMAKKVIDLLKLSYKYFSSGNEWFLMADDDTYIFFENLLKFVRKKNAEDPYIYGYNLINWEIKSYPHGGAGVLFTRESLRRFNKQFDVGKCNFTAGYGDIAIGLCKEIANVSIANSADSNKRDRFHMYSLKRYAKAPFDEWTLKYSQNKQSHGLNCCALDSISFHYVRPEDMISYSKLTFNEALRLEVLKLKPS